jgi:hypothetical protein
MFNKALELFVKTWIWFVLIFTLVSICGQIIGAETVWSGINNVLASADPFRIPSMWTTIIVLLVPGFLANMWLERRRGYGIV